ncbi:unnamed protein product [Symbiodinium sp. KB8]|nr:unnamed protein product [Symbiodinium sp. KB8]
MLVTAGAAKYKYGLELGPCDKKRENQLRNNILQALWRGRSAKSVDIALTLCHKGHLFDPLQLRLIQPFIIARRQLHVSLLVLFRLKYKLLNAFDNSFKNLKLAMMVSMAMSFVCRDWLPILRSVLLVTGLRVAGLSVPKVVSRFKRVLLPPLFLALLMWLLGMTPVAHLALPSPLQTVGGFCMFSLCTAFVVLPRILPSLLVMRLFLLPCLHGLLFMALGLAWCAVILTLILVTVRPALPPVLQAGGTIWGLKLVPSPPFMQFVISVPLPAALMPFSAISMPGSKSLPTSTLDASALAALAESCLCPIQERWHALLECQDVDSAWDLLCRTCHRFVHARGTDTPPNSCDRGLAPVVRQRLLFPPRFDNAGFSVRLSRLFRLQRRIQEASLARAKRGFAAATLLAAIRRSFSQLCVGLTFSSMPHAAAQVRNETHCELQLLERQRLAAWKLRMQQSWAGHKRDVFKWIRAHKALQAVPDFVSSPYGLCAAPAELLKRVIAKWTKIFCKYSDGTSPSWAPFAERYSAYFSCHAVKLPPLDPRRLQRLACGGRAAASGLDAWTKVLRAEAPQVRAGCFIDDRSLRSGQAEALKTAVHLTDEFDSLSESVSNQDKTKLLCTDLPLEQELQGFMHGELPVSPVSDAPLLGVNLPARAVAVCHLGRARTEAAIVVANRVQYAPLHFEARAVCLSSAALSKWRHGLEVGGHPIDAESQLRHSVAEVPEVETVRAWEPCMQQCGIFLLPPSVKAFAADLRAELFSLPEVSFPKTSHAILNVWVDGSAVDCLDPRITCTGSGIFFACDSPCNLSFPVLGPVQTAYRAELAARRHQPVRVHTDCQDVVDHFNHFARDGFLDCAGTDIWLLLLPLLRVMTVPMRWHWMLRKCVICHPMLVPVFKHMTQLCSACTSVWWLSSQRATGSLKGLAFTFLAAVLTPAALQMIVVMTGLLLQVTCQAFLCGFRLPNRPLVRVNFVGVPVKKPLLALIVLKWIRTGCLSTQLENSFMLSLISLEPSAPAGQDY